jgi:hypothetical protein
MDTFDSFWEMDSNKKLNRARRRNDDNSSTFLLRKVELKNYKSYGSAAKVTPVLTYTPYKQTVQDLTNTQSHLHAYYVKTTARTENT